MSNNWRRGKQRGTQLVPARKVNLGERVFYQHTYYLHGERYVNWQVSVVIGKRGRRWATLQTIYGFLKDVPLGNLYIEVP